jgi:hypothetical protein
VLELMLAPLGAPTSENVSGCAGTSLSVAVAVNVYGESSGIVALAGHVRDRRCRVHLGHGQRDRGIRVRRPVAHPHA